MTLRLAIVVLVALVAAFAGMAAPASASTDLGREGTQLTAGAADVLDVLPIGGSSEGTVADGPMMDDDHAGWWNSGWWIVMPIMMVIFWGAVIAVAVWGIRQFTRDRGSGRTPLDIAKERLARGEISKEEFDQLRGDLA